MKKTEAEDVAEILLYYASRAVLLWRTAEDILKHQKNFYVALENDQIIGCVAIEDYYNGLYELRSLAVANHFNGKGVLLKILSDLNSI